MSVILYSMFISRQEKIMLCLKYVGIIDLQKFLLIFIIFLLKIVIMKIVSFTWTFFNLFNRILYCPFFFSCSSIHLLYAMMPVAMATSVNVYINHCIMCLVKCHSFFYYIVLSYEASKRSIFLVREKKTEDTHDTIDDNYHYHDGCHRMLYRINKS